MINPEPDEWFGLKASPPGTKRKKKGPPSIEDPIWTENKAKLIERYLYYFVYVTKHGTYIDGFAGPQRANKNKMWAAKLVLENTPRRIRHFHLFEINPRSVKALVKLRNDQAPREKGEPKRNIDIYPGDCNREIIKFLEAHPIKDKEATFCLLDQRTFECDWATVQALAQHKKGGHKIELFYFLANGWIHRAKSRKKYPKEDMERWWGSGEWEPFFKMPHIERQKYACERFMEELGYKYVNAYSIHEKNEGGRTMYWMVHATDHPLAPVLMNRAYRLALKVKERAEQIPLIAREAKKAALKTA